MKIEPTKRLGMDMAYFLQHVIQLVRRAKSHKHGHRLSFTPNIFYPSSTLPQAYKTDGRQVKDDGFQKQNGAVTGRPVGEVRPTGRCYKRRIRDEVKERFEQFRPRQGDWGNRY